MQRIATKTRKIDLFGAGKDGFGAGNPNTKLAPTQLSATFFNSVQEELANAIEAAGFTLNVADRTQLKQSVALGGQYQHSWKPLPSLVVTQPFEWTSEPVKMVAGSQSLMLVETNTKSQNSTSAICEFTPANRTAGILTFEIVISCTTGTPTAQSHKAIEGKVWWQKSAVGVVTFEAIEELYNEGLLSASVTTPVGGSVVGIQLNIAVNAVYTNFHIISRSWLSLLPWT
jgi:hypothetical protein